MKINNIEIEIERKPIKHIHLSVYPPDGRVHASVPQSYAEGQIRMFVLAKYAWLKEKIEAAKQHNYQLPREYVSGEAHYYRGSLYRLKIDIEPYERQEVSIAGDYIVVRCKRQANAENLLKEWYRTRLKELLPPLVEQWCERLATDVPTYEVMAMHSRWGSCSKVKKHIVFNLELAKKPISCIGYIVAHEVIHLKERTHTDRFYKLLDIYLPQWERMRDTLNEYPIIIAKKKDASKDDVL